MLKKSKRMKVWFERNSRFWGLNHVVLSLFRRTYVESLSLHFLKEKECVFASFREIISICSEKVQKFEVKKVFSIFAKIKIYLCFNLKTPQQLKKTDGVGIRSEIFKDESKGLVLKQF